jgi:hypothetical protein
MTGCTYNNQLKAAAKTGGDGDSNRNSNRGRSNNFLGQVNNCPGCWRRQNHLLNCRGCSNNLHGCSNICRKHGKDCLVLRVGSSAHSAVLSPLVGRDACRGGEAIMGGLSMQVGAVRVVCAGCVCAACPCCFVRLTCLSAPKKLQTTTYWGSPESSQ